MPESRRRKKNESAPRAAKQPSADPDMPSGRWVPITGSVLLILGLVWIVVYYVAGGEIGFIATLSNWNLLIGMALIVGGFLVFTRWK